MIKYTNRINSRKPSKHRTTEDKTMTQTDLKFFTNEPDRDLYTRFSKILQSNTQFFDVLVGYFRTSGFFRLYPAMEAVEKIRILVGLNILLISSIKPINSL